MNFLPGGIFLPIEGGIHIIYVLLVHFFFGQPKPFAEALEVNDLPLTQEFDDIIHIGVIGQPQNIVIGFPCLLLCGQIFAEIRDGIAADLDGCGRPGIAGGGGGINTGGVIHKIRGEAGVFDLAFRKVSGQLMDQSRHHFQMAQFFCTCRRVKMEQIGKVPR